MSFAEVWWCGTAATYVTIRLRAPGLPVGWVLLNAALWPRVVLLWVLQALYDE